jgi:hypothetical protein
VKNNIQRAKKAATISIRRSRARMFFPNPALLGMSTSQMPQIRTSRLTTTSIQFRVGGMDLSLSQRYSA